MPTLTLLFLSANPTNTARLRVDHECRAIDKALRSSEYRDQFALQNHGAVQVDDLQELLLLRRPQIVHFSGHGSPTSQITSPNPAKPPNSCAVRLNCSKPTISPRMPLAPPSPIMKPSSLNSRTT